MDKLKRMIFLPALLMTLCINGQTDLKQFYNEYLKAKRADDVNENISGSPYKNPTFSIARIYMKGMEKTITSDMRYNNYSDEMEFRRQGEDDVYVLDSKYRVDSIKMNDEVWVYKGYIKYNQQGNGFFRQLTKSGCRLYVKSPIIFREEKKPKSGYEDYVPPSFAEPGDEFYAEFDDDVLILIPKGRKKTLKFFEENGRVNNTMSRVNYKEEELVKFCRGLVKDR